MKQGIRLVWYLFLPSLSTVKHSIRNIPTMHEMSEIFYSPSQPLLSPECPMSAQTRYKPLVFKSKNAITRKE